MEEKKIIYLQKVDGVFSADKEKPFERPIIGSDVRMLHSLASAILSIFEYRYRR